MEDYKKKYEETLSRMRSFIQRWNGIEATDSELVLQELREKFPELKESEDDEDERIRKDIIQFFRDYYFDRLTEKIKLGTLELWSEWLEKQDPKKHEEELENAYKCADEVQYRKGYEDAKKKLEKQGEQKVIDKVEQNPAWSEEDERMLGKVITTIRYALSIPIDSEDDSCFVGSSTISWLKSLKERVQPQPKQEWSEEIEKLIEEVADSLRKYSNYVQGGNSKVYILSLADSIESLQPQYTWKPSDEQMTALNNAILLNEYHYNGAVLSTLFEQLKKLREE